MSDNNSEPRRPLKPKEAREQAAEYIGFMTGISIDIGNDETWELPNPSLLDDDQLERYDQLQLSLDDLQHHPDTTDGNGNPVKGAIMDPHRDKDGKLVENYNVRLAKALMGPVVYKKFKAAGGRSTQITTHWQQMNKKMADRQASDSKSATGAEPVAEVSD